MRAAKTESDAIMQLARAANIVTPVSSLVVLESQQDYERFDLKSDPEGLGNAALANQGAVPEPHEWVLLIAGAMLVFYYGIWHKRKTRIV
ncbi:XrtN system VIT domain protein [compost metagenome]